MYICTHTYIYLYMACALPTAAGTALEDTMYIYIFMYLNV